VFWDEHANMENDKFHAVWNGGYRSVGDFLTGANDIVHGNFRDGLHHIADSAIRVASDGVGIAALEVRGVVAGLWKLETRGLDDEEKAYLKQIFGDSLDVDSIRVHEGKAGPASWISDRPFTSGHTIYMKKDPNNPADWPAWMKPEDRKKEWLITLAHESTHVWQFQHGGASYQAESIFHQYVWPEAASTIPTKDGLAPESNAYNWMIGMDQGKSWEDLTVEQQAELIEDAARYGLFDDPNAKFVDDQHHDRTAFIRQGIENLRHGIG
jgi:hypothetical protein